MTGKINLILMGEFTYPYGMAGTKRIQNVISSLRKYSDVSCRVILLRQSADLNKLSGNFNGIPYETVMGDLIGIKMLPVLPVLWYKTACSLKKAFRPGHKNIIYYYGTVFFDSVIPLSYAKKLGYKIIFDVVEDFELAKEISLSYYQTARLLLKNRFSSLDKLLSSGFIVISSYLEEKCSRIGQGVIPIHFMPVSVNMDRFKKSKFKMNKMISLFYAGSFSKEDGLPILLDAFDLLADKFNNIRLVLSGRGDKNAMKIFYDRITQSPHKERIEYKGYLSDNEFYSLLNDIDIPCMTRIDLDFSNAGFPFKLGEYLATGKPVVASRVSDVDRYLINKKSAMIVNPGSCNEVCSAIEFLIEHPALAEDIGVHGRETAITFFDHEQHGKELFRFIKAL